jgi:hypothetical protein
MLFQNYITSNQDAFISKVKSISAAIGIRPSWLMAVMYKESRLNPQAVNNATGATGLIQFMPFTAIGLGTTTQAIRNMNNLQQLDYVEKYFLPYKNKLNSFLDTYLAVFYPAAVGKPANYQFSQTVYTYNKAVDTNNNGILTISDVESWLYRDFDTATAAELKKNYTADTVIYKAFANWQAILVITIVILFLINFYKNKRK